MPGLRADVDPDGLLEYSVVFTDRSLNHMSDAFRRTMRSISSTLKDAYGAQACAVVPGGGTYAMEAVARQLATGRRCLVLRNGWFSYRWSQILDAGAIASECDVLKAAPDGGSPPAFSPPPADEVVAAIEARPPAVVFAPHVETASGIMLSPDYLKAVAEATRGAGGLFVLDCIASGTEWVDMEVLGVDVLVSAPQKSWSASPCAGLVMLRPAALAAVLGARNTSFACDLAMWVRVMEAYEDGRQLYHATMPTDALRTLSAAMAEVRALGFGETRRLQRALGARVRALLEARGFRNVAAPSFRADGVVVSHTRDPDVHSGAKFARAGLQVAAGVPLACGEPADFRTFRIGLFGLDKLTDADRTATALERALDDMLANPDQPPATARPAGPA